MNSSLSKQFKDVIINKCVCIKKIMSALTSMFNGQEMLIIMFVQIGIL